MKTHTPIGSPALTVQLHLLRAVVVDHSQERSTVTAIPQQIVQQREVGWLPGGQGLPAVADLWRSEERSVDRHSQEGCVATTEVDTVAVGAGPSLDWPAHRP